MVWICSKCIKGQHNDCESTWQCDCKCNINCDADVAQKGLAIGGGAALAVGGLALMICTGGLGAIVIGGAMLGAGISSTWNGTEKAIKKERINGKTYVADVAFGAVTGIATGGVGAVGETVAANVVKQGAKEVAKAGVKKLAVRAATGVVTGVAAKTIDEVKQCSTTNKSWEDFGKSFDKNGNENGTAAAWMTSAVIGGLGGASGHVSSNLTKQAASGAVKSVTRIAVSGTTAAVSDATIQGVNIAVGNQDEYDIKRTVATAASSAIMAAAQEGTKNVIYRSQDGKQNMLNNHTNRNIIEEQIPEQDKRRTIQAYDELTKIPQSTTDDELVKAFVVTNAQAREKHHATIIQDYDERIQIESSSKRAAVGAKNHAAAKQHTQNRQNLIMQKKAETARFQAHTPVYEKSDIQHMNKESAHFLVGDKVGQVAIDIKPSDNAPRGLTRVTFDYYFDDQGRRVYKYADYTNQHQYDRMARYGERDGYFSRVHENQDNMLKAKNEATSNLMRNEALVLQRKKEKKEKTV